MAQKFRDVARARLTSSLSAVGTALQVDNGAVFPVATVGVAALDTGDWFKVVLDNETNVEIVYVRSHLAGNSVLMDLLRGQEGTVALAWEPGDVVGLRLTAADAANFESKADRDELFSGRYGDLDGLPSIPASAADVGAVPDTRTVNGKRLDSNISLSAADVGAAASNDPRLSDSRTPTAHSHTAADISDSTSVGRDVLTSANAAAARGAIGAGTSNLALGVTGSDAMPGNTPIPANAADVGALPDDAVLGDLADVDDTGGSTGDVLTRQSGGGYKPQAPSVGATKPSELGQEGATDGQVITWDSTSGKYMPKTPAGGGIPDAPVAAGDAYARENGGWSKLGTAAKAASTDFAAAAHTHAATAISDSTAIGRSVLTAASASAARTAIGAGTSDLALGTTAQTAMPGNTPIPTVPGEISDANIKNGSSSTAGLITGRRFKAAFDEHLGNANISGGPAQIALGNKSGATAIDLGNKPDTEVTVTLTGNTTVSFSNVPGGKSVVTVYLLQDGTGGWDLTHPTGTSMLSGQDGSVDGGAGALSIITYVTLDGGTSWDAVVTDARGTDPGQGGITGNEPLRLFPTANGSYYATFTEAVELDLANATVAGAGDVDWELESGGGFESVSGKGNVYKGNVLKAIVTNFSGYLAIAVPQGAPGVDDLAPGFVETHYLVQDQGTITVTDLLMTATGGGVNGAGLRPEFGGTGKWYFEVEVVTGGGYFGIGLQGGAPADWNFEMAETGGVAGSATVSLGGFSAGDVFRCALNADGANGATAWFAKNGGSWNASGAADPETNVGGVGSVQNFASNTVIYAYGPAGVEMLFRVHDFKYSKPAGFDDLPEAP